MTHPFPTRRSSDLRAAVRARPLDRGPGGAGIAPARPAVRGAGRDRRLPDRDQRHIPDRSEEHTSELQSLMRISYAVFCLKKKIHTHYLTTLIHFSSFVSFLSLFILYFHISI